MLNVQAIRKDFDILGREMRGKPLVYLDNAATTQKPRVVIEALVEYYQNYNANIHRGIYYLSELATEKYEHVREKTARFIGAPDPATIIFTRNATEAINLVAYAWGRQYIEPGDEIVLTEMEHHSNLVPWQLLAQEKGARLRHIGITEDGRLALDDLDEIITERTKLLSITRMSNVLGTINPVKPLIDRAHAKGAVCLIDGAQGVPHLPTRVLELDCDFLAFSAHKMLGPTGVGVLYGKREWLERMPPFLGGGDMISRVWLDRATWNKLPWKYEAGTPNIADVIAFGAALDYLEQIGMEAVQAHERELTAYALEQLSRVPGIRIFGPRHVEDRGGVISFDLEGVHPHDIGQLLDAEGVAIRAGHHCCQPLMERLDVSATARASFYIYNTEEEVDRLVEAVRKVERVFSRAVG